MNNGYGMTGSWTWLFARLMTLGAAVLLGAAVWAVLTVRHRPHPVNTVDGAPAVAGRARVRQLLDERYARGDITTNDYAESPHARSACGLTG